MNYLLPREDNLLLRESKDHTKDKLRILRGYIARFTTSMRQKWKLWYIDLQAGPGKNRFKPSGEIMLGSPLIALTAKYPFHHYRFVELAADAYAALDIRTRASEYVDRIQVIHDDCNTAVDHIVGEIKKSPNSLSLAFLDPEGLELHWETVKKLGRLDRMDLIINFSTSGFTRNARQMMNVPNSKLDSFFGTPDWRDVYSGIQGKDGSYIRRSVIDFYQSRLQTLGYKEINLDGYSERVFKNRKGRQIYTLIYASKHDLGLKFWKGAIEEVSQPRLL